MKKWGIVILAFGVFCGSVIAQEKPVKPETKVADETQTIPDDVKRTLLAMQQREAGLADAMTVLQKERDAIIAEWNRSIARLQAAAPAGYELSPLLIYVKKKEEKK